MFHQLMPPHSPEVSQNHTVRVSILTHNAHVPWAYVLCQFNMTPQISDLNLEELCRQAIADPHSITRDEHNIIRQWPPPDEEDRMCVEKTGHTRAELVAKALATPDSLTRDEAMIVHHPLGVHFETQGSIFDLPGNFGTQLSPLEELRDQMTGVLRGAASEDAKRAVLNAFNRQNAIDQAKIDEGQRRWDEWEAARRLERGTAWIKDLIKNGLLDGECWGFVVFRTGCYGSEQGGEAWRRFREYFDSAAKATVLQWNSGPLLWPKFSALFVEQEELKGASHERLRIEFKRMRDGDTGGYRQLPKGIRTSCFLVVDEAATESDAVKIGSIVRDELDFDSHEDDPVVYLRAVHPDFQIKNSSETGAGVESHGATEQDGDMAGFTGEVTVALPRVFDWLNCVCFESERGEAWKGRPLGKGWHDIYIQTKVPEGWIRDFAPNSGRVSYK